MEISPLSMPQKDCLSPASETHVQTYIYTYLQCIKIFIEMDNKVQKEMLMLMEEPLYQWLSNFGVHEKQCLLKHA